MKALKKSFGLACLVTFMNYLVSYELRRNDQLYYAGNSRRVIDEG